MPLDSFFIHFLRAASLPRETILDNFTSPATPLLSLLSVLPDYESLSFLHRHFFSVSLRLEVMA